MTARGTDWSLALLVALLFASGLGTWFAGDETDAWVFAAHGVLGAALAVLLAWKLRRVWRRLVMPERWDRRTIAGALALTLVASTLISGWLWITAGYVTFAGFTVLAWHTALGAVLTVAVFIHLLLRAKRPRTRDFVGRRQLLEGAAIAGAGFFAWRLQAPLNSLLGLPGEKRRFTGSYEADSFAGNAFPTTSWVADDPQPLDGDYSLAVDGLVARPRRLTAAELDHGDELVATLDCTGGFYSTRSRPSSPVPARSPRRATSASSPTPGTAGASASTTPRACCSRPWSATRPSAMTTARRPASWPPAAAAFSG
jgi:hypothetical protein